MHHEKLDGSGYPLHLKGDKIHYSAKICSICDLFDELTSEKNYREGLTTTKAVKYLKSISGEKLDSFFVEEFLKIIPIYPPGVTVLLNTGVIAIVVKLNPKNFNRPIVRMLYNTKNNVRYNNNLLVDLSSNLSVKIIKEFIPDSKTDMDKISS